MALRSSLASLALAAGLILGPSSPARAKPRSYKVEIESRPSGAKIYLDDENGDRMGTTPYRGRLEPGTYTIYLKRDGFEPSYQTIEVRKTSRRQDFSFDLIKIEFGSVRVTAADNADELDGARVLIDGDEVGNAPGTIDDVATGPHQVEIIKKGYRTFEAWIEVIEDETVEVEVELAERSGGDDDEDEGSDEDDEASDSDDDDDDEDDEDDDDNEDDEDGSIELRQPGQLPFAVVSVGPELGGRKFVYRNPATSNLRPYEALGIPMLRVIAVVNPLATAKNPLLSGWGLVANVAAAKSLNSTTSGAMPQQIGTKWYDYFLGGRFQLAFGDAFVGLEGGLGGQSFTFGGNDQLRSEVPDVSYRFTRVGGDLGGTFGKITAMAAMHYRMVSDIGLLRTRFAQTEVTAYGGSFSGVYAITPHWDVRIVGNFNRYQHVFTVNDTGEYNAAGGTDQFFGAMLGVGYSL